MINIKLTDREFQKLSEETGISQFILQKIYSMELMRDSKITDILIEHDYKILRQQDKYKPSQIITRLSMFYHVTKHRIQAIVKHKRFMQYYCEDCGKLIPKYLYTRNEGLCDDCVAKSIEIP